MLSLVIATDIDVLAPDRVLTRRDGYWVVRCPSNPDYFNGNGLVFDAAPAAGDGARWDAVFAAELPELRHRMFSWDLTDGTLGAARAEFPDFTLEQTAGLVAKPGDLSAHPREARDVGVRALDPDDGDGWAAVLALWEAENAADPEGHPTEDYRRFATARLSDLRGLFRDGRGAWFVAVDGAEIVGSLGVVVTDGRARYQSVDTRASHRGRGIASRLVVEAAARIAARHDVASFVIAADVNYHALGIYESLGFKRVEQVAQVWRRPR